MLRNKLSLVLNSVEIKSKPGTLLLPGQLTLCVYKHPSSSAANQNIKNTKSTIIK
ncbi:hypothetical protein Smp_169000 [Schistosoma mansoni]|uniref:hypothetical protein n=1 Tax=Schistosoma mansoni TaxID=6183 RepID=UPI00022DC98E|nr:hypothetical protein Smp_169000 [Schistosoma mansoni]|eukprot:XP_018654833.1 hypothetical protein Smp_169000 [Schistosoma mansoni]